MKTTPRIAYKGFVLHQLAFCDSEMLAYLTANIKIMTNKAASGLGKISIRLCGLAVAHSLSKG